MISAMYRVTLSNTSGITDASVSQAVQAFREALERALGGGPAAVAQARAAYMQALATYGGGPLPMDASRDDQDAVDRWHEAFSAAREGAFLGWVRPPAQAHFTVEAA